MINLNTGLGLLLLSTIRAVTQHLKLETSRTLWRSYRKVVNPQGIPDSVTQFLLLHLYVSIITALILLVISSVTLANYTLGFLVINISSSCKTLFAPETIYLLQFVSNCISDEGKTSDS